MLVFSQTRIAAVKNKFRIAEHSEKWNRSQEYCRAARNPIPRVFAVSLVENVHDLIGHRMPDKSRSLGKPSKTDGSH